LLLVASASAGAGGVRLGKHSRATRCSSNPTWL
jgi:hypothetical protein